MQWWNQQRSRHLQHQADQLRDQPLQEIFAIRRSLELIEFDSACCFNLRQDWLSKAEQIQRSIEQISHHLSPFYVEESLPLAIQYELANNKTFDSIRLNLPIDWTDQSSEHNRIILAALRELLHLVPDSCSAQAVCVQLKSKKRLAELVVQITNLDQKALAICRDRKELKYLAQSFRVLTSGWCLHRQQEQTITWYFYWQLCESDG